MSINSKYDNTLQAQSSMENALARAQDSLRAQGINYPLYDDKQSPDANYARLEAYKAKETGLIREYLNPRPSSRPLEIDNVQPKKDWGSYYDR